ncbi:MAG: hypothetical protein EZS28_054654 [Streblomastix strix]|uniref:C2H2-type domain-containing protein n=1 Tax=Streblomastix strix TaxID=222440 RepID=A0A5J4QGR0_9EUKA|nr:MAG: hypothetical protein EZS28_054654 [Streblomastix strix]
MKMYHADELNESDFSEELQNDEKLKTGQKKKRKAKKVPKLKPSNTPFKGRRCPVVMSEEQTKKFNLWFPKNPIFECWYEGCCRQFKSEYGLDVHKLQHKKKDK